MHIVYPIKIAQTFHAKDSAGKLYKMTEITKADLARNLIFVKESGVPTKVKGYDSSQNNEGRGTKLTNLVGIENGELQKECPHCDETKDQNEFGEAGRTTNEFRDQSHCNACRQLAGQKK